MYEVSDKRSVKDCLTSNQCTYGNSAKIFSCTRYGQRFSTSIFKEASGSIKDI